MQTAMKSSKDCVLFEEGLQRQQHLFHSLQ